MLDSIFLVRRQEPPFWLTAVSYAAGLALGLLTSAALLIWAGVPGDALISEFLVATFLTSDGLAQTVTAAIPLALVGLASAVAMRVRFWNIGVEGQVWLGAIGASWIALDQIGPEFLRLPLMMVVACLAGAVWISISLVLKLAFGVSEVISTLLLGSIAFLLVQHLLFGVWRDPANNFPISAEFPAASQFSPLGWGQVHGGLYVCISVGVVVWFMLEQSRIGFFAEAVGLNAAAARAAGLPVTATISTLVLASGGLSGLAGAVIVAGTEHRLGQAVGTGYLFSALLVAYLARARPLWVMVVAVLVGAVYTAGTVLKVFYGVSEAMIVLMQGAVLISILMSQFFSTYSIGRKTRPIA